MAVIKPSRKDISQHCGYTHLRRRWFSERCDQPCLEGPSCPPYPRTKARDAIAIFDDEMVTRFTIKTCMDGPSLNYNICNDRNTFLLLKRKGDSHFAPLKLLIDTYTVVDVGIELSINWGNCFKYLRNGQYEGDIYIAGDFKGVWLFIKMSRPDLKVYEYASEIGPPDPPGFYDMNKGMRSPIIRVEEQIEENPCKEECDSCNQ